MRKAAIFLRVPTGVADQVVHQWSELCEEHGLSPELKLPVGTKIQGYTGAEFMEMAVPVAEALAPVLTAVIGYLAGRGKGDAEISDGVRTYKFRNLTPEKAKEFITLFHKQTASSGN